MLTLQEIFDKSANHLLTQMKKSQDTENGPCLYRGPNGTMCAIGPFIPDDEIGFVSLSASASAPTVIEVLKKVGVYPPNNVFQSPNYRLVVRLQSVHDDAPVEHWADLLAQVAREFGLEKSQLLKERINESV